MMLLHPTLDGALEHNIWKIDVNIVKEKDNKEIHQFADIIQRLKYFTDHTAPQGPRTGCNHYKCAD